ncbi:nonstructural protein [Peromfec virus RodF8_50]|uniref:Nonstructural protein n=1 Tax=Peromfec virus RodF8_50 TaxID=2929380 RepID=A0A976N1R6_9VIRU|nr:nonstructural protein [Peromfec virus RodF8_50]
MTYKLYSLFDRVTATYGDIILAVNDDDAKRRVAYTLQSNPYKQDLVLYSLGVYDATQGVISSSKAPVMVCNVVECYGDEVKDE